MSSARTPVGTTHEPTQRRSLSGKLVGRAPAKPWWIVSEERREATKPKDREPAPAPLFVCECREPVNNDIECRLTGGEHLSTEYRGFNRRERRSRGERGGYTKNLQLRLGASLAQ